MLFARRSSLQGGFKHVGVGSLDRILLKNYSFAISSFYRSDNGIHGYFKLDCPATAERIRLACVDDLVKMAATPLKEGEKPWSIRA